MAHLNPKIGGGLINELGNLNKTELIVNSVVMSIFLQIWLRVYSFHDDMPVTKSIPCKLNVIDTKYQKLSLKIVNIFTMYIIFKFSL